MKTYEERIDQLKKDLKEVILKTEMGVNNIYIREIFHTTFVVDENYEVVKAIAKRDNLPLPEIMIFLRENPLFQ